jgi:hypothetical protein
MKKALKNQGLKAPPVGEEHPSESTGKSEVESSGASESAAVDPELAIVIDAWDSLTQDLRSAIVGIVHKTCCPAQSGQRRQAKCENSIGDSITT